MKKLCCLVNPNTAPGIMYHTAANLSVNIDDLCEDCARDLIRAAIAGDLNAQLDSRPAGEANGSRS